MKIGEVIQRVQSLYQKGVESDDTRLTNKHIYNKLISSRGYLISTMLKKRLYVSEMNYQKLRCVELITVNSHECNCLPDTTQKILRSRYKIPNIISGDLDLAIKVVTDNTGKRISKTSSYDANMIQYNKFTNKSIYYFITNNYIYVLNTKLLKLINIEAVFEDVIKAYRFPNYCSDKANADRAYLCPSTEICENCGCIKNIDYDFPVDTSLIDLIVENAVSELIKLFYSVKEDKSNDTSDVETGQQYISSNLQQNQQE